MSMSQRPFNSIQDQRSFTIMALLSSCCDFQFYPRSTQCWGHDAPGEVGILSILSKINSHCVPVVELLDDVSFNSIQDQRGTIILFEVCEGVLSILSKINKDTTTTAINSLLNMSFQFYPRSTWGNSAIHYSHSAAFQFYPRSTRWPVNADEQRRNYLSILSKINASSLSSKITRFTC